MAKNKSTKLHPNVKELSGLVFNRWTILRYVRTDKKGNTFWLCRCNCGNELVVNGYSMIYGKSQSCGCLQVELLRSKPRHGITQTPLWGTWYMMIQRCRNKDTKGYKNYGERGIEVCGRWEDFRNFRTDMGERPTPKHTLDRIDNDGDYCPENCRWATRKEQSRNKSDTKLITYKGESLILTDWAKKMGLSLSTLNYRINIAQWPIEKALTAPPNRKHYGKRKSA